MSSLKKCKWLVETELASTSRRVILYSTNGGQIAAKMLGAFSESYSTKTKMSRNSVDRFCSEAVRFKKNAFRFGCSKREVQEIFSRRERPASRWAGMTLSLDNCSLARRFACFSRSAGSGRNFGFATRKLKHCKFQRP